MNEASEIRSNSPLNMSIDESIEEKVRNLLPGLITQIKSEVQEELMNQSRMSEAFKKSEVSDEEVKPKVVHNHIICDGCGADPVMGVRYKCAVCNDYDLCEKCEATSDHDHPFLKIKHPGQRPLKIFVAMRDEEDSFECNGQRRSMDGLSNLIEHGMNFAQQFMQRANVIPQNQEKEAKKEEKVEEKKVEVKEETIEQKKEEKP
jgi:hypothetical protein